MNSQALKFGDDPIARTALRTNLRFYKKHALDFSNKTKMLSLEEAYAPFLRLIPIPAQILDAGCGAGRDSAVFVHRGYTVTAIDASRAMIQEARKLELDAKVMTFQNLSYREQFDGIWACASLLHVAKSEIADVINRFASALRYNGVLFASLKEGNGEQIAEDGRFFAYYTLDEFASILQHARWSLIEARRVLAQDGRYWLNFMARRPVL